MNFIICCIELRTHWQYNKNITIIKVGVIVGCRAIPNDTLKKIREEYIENPNATYESLAGKYDVSLYALQEIGRKGNENWRKLRQESAEKTAKAVADAISEKVRESILNTTTYLYSANEAVAKCLYETLRDGKMSYKIAEMCEKAAAAIGKCMKNGGIRDELEKEEIRARINSLNSKNSSSEGDTSGIQLVINR